MTTTLFIADLHLSETLPAVTDKFLYFMQQDAARANALYILGDLFSAWIGEDHEPKLNKIVSQAIRELMTSGIPVYFMHGNRDFLISKKFCEQMGCELLPDPAIITINQTPVLLSHGDIFCTDDVKYQKIRKRLRHPLVKKLFLSFPLKLRQKILKKFKQDNAIEKISKSEKMMDISAKTINQFIHQYHIDYLVHGHTHQTLIEKFPCDHHEITRIVLGAWDETPNMLVCTPGKTSGSLMLELKEI